VLEMLTDICGFNSDLELNEVDQGYRFYFE